SIPLESKSMQPSKNSSITELIEVYTVKRRKDNFGSSVEIENFSSTENAKVEANENLKRKSVKKKTT
ncbi:9009_t:CDS:1, partial [Gigaspora margarita]